MPTLTKEALHGVTTAIFRATGAPDDLAAQVADVLVDNHLAGHDSHGILRIPEYVQSVKAGEIVPAARPRVIEESATSALVSGNWAFGQVTGVFAADLAAEKAKRERVAVLSVVQAGTGRLAASPNAAAGGVHAFAATVPSLPTTASHGGAARPGDKPDLLFDSQPRRSHHANFATSATLWKIKVAMARTAP
jgi:LDH2 family malate/lactate/ureidoglycolate dehydrogenase